MGIKYIVGRGGAGKSFRVFTEIKEQLQKNEGNKLILLVPEQFTLQAERDLINKLDLAGIIDVEVLSFTRLAHHVFNEVGGLAKIHINDIGKNMVLRRVLEEVKNSLTIYKKSTGQEGFVAKVNELITEFKQQNITPELLNTEVAKLQEASLLRMKLSDVAIVYEAFNKYLESRYIDTEDHMNMLVEKMEAVSFLDDAIIWVDGFHRFTPLTLKIISKLMEKCKGVNITFTLDKAERDLDGDLFTLPQKTFNRIRRLVEALQLPEEVLAVNIKDNPMAKAAELVHLEGELYAYPYKQYSQVVENIKLFAATNLYTEVENAAAQIISLVRDRHYRWRDIAVITGDMGSYGMLVKRVFQDYGIPYFLDEKRSIMEHPVIELIISALQCVRRGYLYEDVFRLLKTGFSDLSRGEIEELENYVLQFGIKREGWFKEFEKPEGAQLETLNRSRLSFSKPLKKLQGKLQENRTIAEMTKAVFAFMQDLNIEDKLETWISSLKENGRLDYVNENTQIWNTVMAIFDQMVEILGDNKVTLKEYISILEAGFMACEIGVIPSTIDQVLVGNLSRSRSQDIKALFVLGVNDGVLPANNSSEGILLDHERIFLKETGVELGFDSESQMYEEKFLIYNMLTKPSRYLWISYALADQESKALRPSIVIDRFKKLFNIEVASDVISTLELQVGLVTTPNSSFKYLVENIRLNIDEKPIEDIWWEVYGWYYHQPSWKERLQLIIDGLFHENQIDYISSNNAKELYQSPIRASISRLERFANCPFSHFVAYGLKPAERKEYQLKAPDIGKIFHYTLESFEEELHIRSLDWKQLERGTCDELVDRVVDRLAEGFEYGVLHSTHRYKYLLKRLKRISRRALWTLTEHLKRGSFSPMGHEIRFGIGEEIPPIVVELEDGEELLLEGRIDRVDLLESDEGTYVKIIDYKSGNKDFSLTDVYYGLQLQLFVYLEAVLAHKRDTSSIKLHPAGIFYFKIDDPMIKNSQPEAEAIEKEINKKLKLKGLALKDVKIIREMDNSIEKYSEILPVSLNKDNELSKQSAVLAEEDFSRVIKHVRFIIKEISKEMLRGKVLIEPCKKGKQTSCQYCQYSAICQFDGVLENNKYKYIIEGKNEEILAKMQVEEVLGDA